MGSVNTPVMGEAAASDQDVVKPGGPFPLYTSLYAAREMYELADAVYDARFSAEIAQVFAQMDWRGPHRQVFDQKMQAFVTTANSMERALRTLAVGLGQAWASFRGQQNRINFARWAEDEAERQNDSGWRGVPVVGAVGGFFAGDWDPGPEPDNPGAPTPSGFEETCDVVHPEYGP